MEYLEKLKDILGEDNFSASDVDCLSYSRDMSVHVGAPDVDYPLCFCDARSVRREELTPIRVAEYGGLKTEFDAFAVSAPTEGRTHDWYVFPDMTPDEVVAFRAYDSDRVERGEPFWTPHVSFRDPNRDDAAAPRTSMEMRAICLFLG